MTDLITRLENAKGPDRELDLLIAQTYAPDLVVLQHENGQNVPSTHWRYTGSIDAAVALCERLLPGWQLNFCKTGDETEADVCSLTGRFLISGNIERYGRSKAHPAIALLIAILRALSAKDIQNAE